MFHLQTKIIQRSKGQSAIRSAAYRSASRLKNEKTGAIYSYLKKKDLQDCFVLMPQDLNAEWKNREKLWNRVEAFEKRKDARVAREFEVALPVEFSLAENRQVIADFAQANFVSRRLIVDVAIHEKPKLPRNPHAHLLLTTRPIAPDGTFGKKDRSINRKEYLKFIREAWAAHLNNWYNRKGIEKVVSAKSYKEQGIQREPTQHIGPEETRTFAIMGIMGDRQIENKAIRARNLEREASTVPKSFQEAPTPKPIQKENQEQKNARELETTREKAVANQRQETARQAALRNNQVSRRKPSKKKEIDFDF